MRSPTPVAARQSFVGRYTLKSGEYDVVVKSRGDKFVRPFKGTWSMNSGWTYSNCFYIVTNPNPVEQQSNPKMEGHHPIFYCGALCCFQ
jgi:hypothetical protein